MSLLTPRQQQVLTFAAYGYTSEETARRLNITMETVKTHRKWVMAALGAKNMAHATALAFREGILH